MSKPIESGCKAVIVNSEAGNDGIIVTVGEYKGLWHKNDKPYWGIDKSVPNSFGQIVLQATNVIFVA